MEGEGAVRVNAKIVHIDFQPKFSDHVGKDVIHECLEGGWSVAETEEHDSGFKQVKGSDEGSFPLIRFLDANVVISPSYIEFGEVGGVLHVIH